MRSRTRMIAAAAAVTAALAAGTGAAVASTTGAKPGAHARTMSATGRAASPRPADERQAQNAMTAAVAQTLHVSTARVSAALRPLFAAGHAETSSPAFAAAARSLGVSTHQLEAALIHAKESVAASMHIKQGSRGSRTVGAKSAGANPAAERQAQNAMTAAAAQALHVSTARVSAALRQLFAAGHADTSSPAFAAAARSLGVSTHQLAAALMHAKESLATGN